MKFWWLRDGLIYGLSGVLARFVGFFLAPFYTRLMSQEQYGVLDLATALTAILLILSESQMISGYIRSYYEARERGERHLLAGSVMVYFTFSAAVLIGALWTFRERLAAHLPGFEATYLLPILVSLFPQQIIALGLGTLRMERKARSYLLINVSQICLAAVFGLIAAGPLDYEAVGVLWGLALARVIMAAVSLFVLMRSVKVRPSLQYMRELAAFSLPIVPAVLGNWTQSYVSRFFIVTYLSLANLGVYSIAAKVAGVAAVFTMAFRMVWEPTAVALYGKEGTEPQFVRAAELYGFCMFGFLVLLTSGSPFLVRILVPESYWGAERYIPILCGGFILSDWSMLFSSGNNWARKTYYNTIGNLIAALAAVGLLWWGTERFGLIHVTCAYAVVAVLKNQLVLYTSQRNHYMPFAHGTILATISVYIAYVLAVYGLTLLEWTSPLKQTLLSLVIGLVALSILALTGLRKDSRAWLRETVHVAGARLNRTP